MVEIYQELFESFCQKMNSDPNSWNVITIEPGCFSAQHRESGTIFEIKVG